MVCRGASMITTQHNSHSAQNVTWLENSPDFQPGTGTQTNNSGFEVASGNIAECLTSNVRFSQPANDDYTAQQTDKTAFAPVHKICREAQLLRMYAEILAGLDRETA